MWGSSDHLIFLFSICNTPCALLCFVCSSVAAWGRGVALPDSLFLLYCPLQQTTRGIAHRVGFGARMEDTRLLKCVMFVDYWGRRLWGWGQEKEWTRCLLDDLRASDINADQWASAAQDEGGWYKTAEQAAKRFKLSQG